MMETIREGRMRRLAFVVAASAALAVSACSVLGRQAFQQPVVNLRDVKVRGLGITGGNLDVMLNVYNPNHYRLDATRLTYRVELAGDSITIASGALDSRFTVQESDSQVVTIPVTFT